MPPATIVPLGVIDPIEKSCVCTNPLPVSNTICGLPGALSVSVKAPTLDAVDDGVNVTVIVQFVVGCSGAAVQLSLSAKSPLAVMLEKVIGVVPSFVAITPCGAEVWPTGTLPKSRLEADSVSVDVVPVKTDHLRTVRRAVRQGDRRLAHSRSRRTKRRDNRALRAWIQTRRRRRT